MARKPAGNAFDPDCPTRQVLDRIGDKWTVLVLILLSDGPLRFNALRRAIPGVSQKMLSQVLKALERDGMVSRRAFPTVPVTVEYSITALGGTLVETVDQLRLWAERHLPDVQKAQTRFDRTVLDKAA